MKKYLAIAIAGAVLLGAPLPATASASAPMFDHGPVVGCAIPGYANNEWLNPYQAPSRCVFTDKHDKTWSDPLHGLRWSNWGRSTATATGWLAANPNGAVYDGGGPFRVTVRLHGLVTASAFGPSLANIPICRDNIRYYQWATITMPFNGYYEANSWTDALPAPTRQC